MTFVKGVSGNPNGRKRSETPTADMMRRRLNHRASKDDPTERELILDALFAKAKEGDINHLKVILERTEGKVPDRIAGADGGPIAFTFAIDKPGHDDDN